MDPPVTHRDDAEVRLHKRRFFRELGFERHQIDILELAGVDPHDAKRLLAKGCSHELAIDILT